MTVAAGGVERCKDLFSWFRILQKEIMSGMCSKSLCWLDGSLRLKELGLKLSEGCKCSEFFGCIVVSYKYTL